MEIDLIRVAKLLKQSGINKVGDDFWTNTLMDILEQEYSLETNLDEILKNIPVTEIEQVYQECDLKLWHNKEKEFPYWVSDLDGYEIESFKTEEEARKYIELKGDNVE